MLLKIQRTHKKCSGSLGAIFSNIKLFGSTVQFQGMQYYSGLVIL